jgi:tRNA threonylcarbamoyladenosine biosynthesis protein TsaB
MSNIILSIETTGKICSVALSNVSSINRTDTEILAEYSICVGNKHDKFCAELCNRILCDNEIDVKELSAVAVSIGPGSFTGLRIGLSIAKGLCFSDGNDKQLPLITIPTLSAMAEFVSFSIDKNRYSEYEILSVISSHSDIVFYQLFDIAARQIDEISQVSIQELIELFSKKKLILTTNVALNIPIGTHLLHYQNIDAKQIAYSATMQFLNKNFSDPITILPLYFQDFIPK